MASFRYSFNPHTGEWFEHTTTHERNGVTLVRPMCRSLFGGATATCVCPLRNDHVTTNNDVTSRYAIGEVVRHDAVGGKVGHPCQ